MMKMMIMTMTAGCFFFCQSNCVQNPCKNNATCQSGFTKVIGVFVPLDLRV